MTTTKQVPWNKGKKMTKEAKKKLSESLKGRKAWNKGIPQTEEHKKKLSALRKGRIPWNKGIKTGLHNPSEFKKGDGVGENNHNWKGDKVSYRNLHRWVVRYKGKATKCENCGKEGTGRQIHWSNNDHSYKRNLDDWTSLCAKCHKRHDKMLRGKKGDEVREHPADNPEPSLDSNIFEGATTRSRVLKGQ